MPKTKMSLSKDSGLHMTQMDGVFGEVIMICMKGKEKWDI
jgi:hypothetical protein